MKRLLGAMVALMAVFACATSANSALASGFNDEISVFVNGVPIELSYPADVENGRVLVPFRDIFEALDLEVSWDSETQTVSGGDVNSRVSFVLGQSTATVNGKEVALDAPARAINGHTLVPVRLVGESTGFGVKWDQTNRRVLVGNDNVQGDIFLASSNRAANVRQLRAAAGVGEYEGYTILQGYPGDNEFGVCCSYSEDGSERFITYIDKRGLDPNESIHWSYNGTSYVNTRLQVSMFCRDSSALASALGMHTYDSVGLFSPQWLLDTFGQVYLDCQRGWLFEQDAGSIAGAYIDYVCGIDRYAHQNSSSLKPDSKFEIQTEENGWIEDTYLEEYGLGIENRIADLGVDGYTMTYTLINADTGAVVHELGDFRAVDEEGVPVNGIRVKSKTQDGYTHYYFYKQDLTNLGLI